MTIRHRCPPIDLLTVLRPTDNKCSDNERFVESEKLMRRFLVLLIIVVFMVCPAVSFAQEDDANEETDDSAVTEEKDEKDNKDKKERKPAQSNLPLNFSGRHGLIFTSSTHTPDFKDVEPGFGYIYENSSDPKYYKHTIAANLSIGLPKRVMLYFHIPYIVTDLEYGKRRNALNQVETSYSNKEKNGLGTIEAGFQWAFFMQDKFLPGMAAGITILTPTGDYTQRLSTVKYYGFKVNLAMSLEIIDLFFTEYAFAILADGSFVFRDLGYRGDTSDARFGEDGYYEEKNGEFHLGMLFPLDPRNFTNIILEYDGKYMMGTTHEEDYNGLIFGFRVITDNLGVTVGGEYLINEIEKLDYSWRAIGSLSYRFW